MTDDLTTMASGEIVRSEACSLANVRRVAAMLNIDPTIYSMGDPLPRGWQFILMAADTRKSEIRPDGFPGLGVPFPDLGLPRLVLGGRTVEFRGDILIGEDLTRKSRIQSICRKATPSGPLAVVKIEHEIYSAFASTPSVIELQTYILMQKLPPKSIPSGPISKPPEEATRIEIDDTLLFHYSALGFNSHKIHIDRTYAREIEGYPDLVVNGGLATLLLTEQFRSNAGEKIVSLSTKHLAPLFSGRPVYVTSSRANGAWHLDAYDDAGTKALELVLSSAGD